MKLYISTSILFLFTLSVLLGPDAPLSTNLFNDEQPDTDAGQLFGSVYPEKEGFINEPEETLIYENLFNDCQESWKEDMAENWVMEGKGIAECQDGYLSLRSEIFTEPRDRHGHFNFWLDRDFPENVAFEWDFRYAEPGKQGLAIIIWAAKGRNGEDIFDPNLPERRGEIMTDFTTDALNCYHTSYIARSRKKANMRKNYGMHLLTQGHDISSISEPGEWHTIRLEQYNGIIRLLFDGEESFSYTDDGSEGGPMIDTGGKMAFRQQNNLYRGDYRNFRVYALE